MITRVQRGHIIAIRLSSVDITITHLEHIQMCYDAIGFHGSKLFICVCISYTCMQVAYWSKWYVVGSSINPSHLKQQIEAG